VSERKRRGRTAGLWYAAMAVTGPIGILYGPSQIHVPGDAAATAASLIAHPTIARLGVAASVVCQVTFVCLVLALERYFEGVEPRLSRLMRALVLVAAPIAIINEILVLGALEITSGAGASLPAPVRDPLGLVLLDLHALGVSTLAGLFWGLWLFPFGLLAIRSSFVPKLLGVLLILGGVAYVTDATLALMAPALHARATDLLLLPLAVGEISTVAWLLIKGAREPSVGN
jgi:hypothetical protein